MWCLHVHSFLKISLAILDVPLKRKWFPGYFCVMMLLKINVLHPEQLILWGLYIFARLTDVKKNLSCVQLVISLILMKLSHLVGTFVFPLLLNAWLRFLSIFSPLVLLAFFMLTCANSLYVWNSNFFIAYVLQIFSHCLVISLSSWCLFSSWTVGAIFTVVWFISLIF